MQSWSQRYCDCQSDDGEPIVYHPFHIFQTICHNISFSKHLYWQNSWRAAFTPYIYGDIVKIFHVRYSPKPRSATTQWMQLLRAEANRKIVRFWCFPPMRPKFSRFAKSDKNG